MVPAANTERFSAFFPFINPKYDAQGLCFLTVYELSPQHHVIEYQKPNATIAFVTLNSDFGLIQK